MEFLFSLIGFILFIMIIVWIHSTAKNVKRLSKSAEDIKILLAEIDTVIKVKQLN